MDNSIGNNITKDAQIKHQEGSKQGRLGEMSYLEGRARKSKGHLDTSKDKWGVVGRKNKLFVV